MHLPVVLVVAASMAASSLALPSPSPPNGFDLNLVPRDTGTKGGDKGQDPDTAPHGEFGSLLTSLASAPSGSSQTKGESRTQVGAQSELNKQRLPPPPTSSKKSRGRRHGSRRPEEPNPAIDSSDGHRGDSDPYSQQRMAEFVRRLENGSSFDSKDIHEDPPRPPQSEHKEQPQQSQQRPTTLISKKSIDKIIKAYDENERRLREEAVAASEASRQKMLDKLRWSESMEGYEDRQWKWKEYMKEEKEKRDRHY